MTHRDRTWRGWRFYGTPVETSKDVVWQSADGRVTSNNVAWPFSDFFQNSSNCLIPRKTVVWQSADGRVSSDLVLTSKKCCLKVSKLSRDGPALLFPWFLFVRHHILPRRCISRLKTVCIFNRRLYLIGSCATQPQSSKLLLTNVISSYHRGSPPESH